ncbi:MAG: LysM peptidoglycan-binding domain-containing protein, partial [Ilumatobacter sp.]|nr:LysM peptidoglycan-binding domain-containing protein [Ilumatobacter sp.]
MSAGLLLGVTTIVAAPAAAAPAAPASAQYYTVQSGDYLMGIAAKLDVRLSDLLAANNLTVTSLIYPGMQLVVPGAAAATPSAPVTQYYTVARGDYLTGIAVKLSVKLSALLEANGLTIQSVILPGQRLVVPAGGSLPSAPSSSSSSSGSGASPAAVSTA